jgi:DNA gyrase subunit A
LQCYIDYRIEVIERRTRHDLRRARDRAHVVEGLTIALDRLDAVISTIRAAASAEEARAALVANFGLSEVQANAILDMQLRRLTSLERQKLIDELTALRESITDLEDIIARPDRVRQIIKDELADLADRFGDVRRTIIIPGEDGILTEADLQPRQPVLACLTDRGYAKRMVPDAYVQQSRGGRGRRGMATRDDDRVKVLTLANTHDYMLFFTDRGRVLRTRVWTLPEVQPAARGTSVVNLVNLFPDEKVSSVLIMRDGGSEGNLIFATRRGEVKRTALADFAHVRQNGLKTMNLEPGDEIGWVVRTSGNDRVTLVTAKGMSISFHEDDLRVSGRTSGGVRGIRLDEGDEVVGFVPSPPAGSLVLIGQNGIGKQTPLTRFRVQKRGGKGVRSAAINERTGTIVAAVSITPDDTDLMAITRNGIIIRMRVGDIRVCGRFARGVRIMRPDAGDEVVALSAFGPNDLDFVEVAAPVALDPEDLQEGGDDQSVGDDGDDATVVSD